MLNLPDVKASKDVPKTPFFMMQSDENSNFYDGKDGLSSEKQCGVSLVYCHCFSKSWVWAFVSYLAGKGPAAQRDIGYSWMTLNESIFGKKSRPCGPAIHEIVHRYNTDEGRNIKDSTRNIVIIVIHINLTLNNVMLDLRWWRFFVRSTAFIKRNSLGLKQTEAIYLYCHHTVIVCLVSLLDFQPPEGVFVTYRFGWGGDSWKRAKLLI